MTAAGRRSSELRLCEPHSHPASVDGVPAAQDAVEHELRAVGARLWVAFPSTPATRCGRSTPGRWSLRPSDRELRAALFRFVDVVPACRSLDDLARHLTGSCRRCPRRRRRSPPRCRSRHTKAGRAALGCRRGGRRATHGAPVHRRRVAGGGARRRCARCGSAASRAPSTCSARRPSRRPRPTATRPAARRRLEQLAPATARWPAREVLEARRDRSGCRARTCA